ncbi:unnamed protein product [Vitrella brassicaformis CCMP3155]|uniref:Generative cell specific-1/HAP2 domain-containing protein n=1 Tax=Vitrella brassicaformis (strain CCMP3155) TaxID=1169540 RepID=A0A0G4GG95_VITBC|nr:unnamed protein product [Vitrella brassicaformis CCMP3155]|eukprot:CEM28636.1 unnamed protein product [Vitrella brassicaformis CCMP3155]
MRTFVLFCGCLLACSASGGAPKRRTTGWGHHFRHRSKHGGHHGWHPKWHHTGGWHHGGHYHTKPRPPPVYYVPPPVHQGPYPAIRCNEFTGEAGRDGLPLLKAYDTEQILLGAWRPEFNSDVFGDTPLASVQYEGDVSHLYLDVFGIDNSGGPNAKTITIEGVKVLISTSCQSGFSGKVVTAQVGLTAVDAKTGAKGPHVWCPVKVECPPPGTPIIKCSYTPRCVQHFPVAARDTETGLPYLKGYDAAQDQIGVMTSSASDPVYGGQSLVSVHYAGRSLKEEELSSLDVTYDTEDDKQVLEVVTVPPKAIKATTCELEGTSSKHPIPVAVKVTLPSGATNSKVCPVIAESCE